MDVKIGTHTPPGPVYPPADQYAMVMWWPVIEIERPFPWSLLFGIGDENT